ncbi:MAG: cupin domain-containing protein [Bacillota bacterium]
MFVSHEKDRAQIPVSPPGARNVLKQSLVGPGEGWQGWVMRQFTLTDRGCTPRHRHPWPHVNYVVRGEGILFLEGSEHRLTTGSIAYVPAGAEHQFNSTAPEDFVFICIVPVEGDV